MVRPEGFEPPASWFVARRSIQLSYGRARGAHIITSKTKRHSGSGIDSGRSALRGRAARIAKSMFYLYLRSPKIIPSEFPLTSSATALSACGGSSGSSSVAQPRSFQVCGIGRGLEAVTVSISSLGAITGMDAGGCGFAGAATIHVKGNVYDVSVTFGGGHCSNGTSVVTGIAYYNATKLSAGLNSKSDEWVFVWGDETVTRNATNARLRTRPNASLTKQPPTVSGTRASAKLLQIGIRPHYGRSQQTGTSLHMMQKYYWRFVPNALRENRSVVLSGVRAVSA
jgi:hypothetical protein